MYNYINEELFIKWLGNVYNKPFDYRDIMVDLGRHYGDTGSTHFEVPACDTVSGHTEVYDFNVETFYSVDGNVKYSAIGYDFKDENEKPCDYPKAFIDSEIYDTIDDIIF